VARCGKDDGIQNALNYWLQVSLRGDLSTRAREKVPFAPTGEYALHKRQFASADLSHELTY
jgi:hypothetical protein